MASSGARSWPTGSSDQGGGGHRHHVLLVDDDFFTRMVIRKMLDAEQHTVAQCTSGQEALELLTRKQTGSTQPERFNVIMLDWVLGDMTGRDVLQHVRENTSVLNSIHIIIVSADQLTPAVQGELKALGAKTFWTKPVQIETIRQLSSLAPLPLPPPTLGRSPVLSPCALSSCMPPLGEALPAVAFRPAGAPP